MLTDQTIQSPSARSVAPTLALCLCLVAVGCGWGSRDAGTPTAREAGSLTTTSEAPRESDPAARPDRERPVDPSPRARAERPTKNAGTRVRSLGGGPVPPTEREAGAPTESAEPETTAELTLEGVEGPELPPDELAALEEFIMADLDELSELIDMEGTMRWSGPLVRGALIVIEEDRADSGSLGGTTLPGLPVDLRISEELVEIVETPDVKSFWTRLVLRALVDRPDGASIDIHWNVKQ